MSDPCVCGSQPICPACDRYPPTCTVCIQELHIEARQRARKENAT